MEGPHMAIRQQEGRPRVISKKSTIACAYYWIMQAVGASCDSGGCGIMQSTSKNTCTCTHKSISTSGWFYR